MYGLLEKFLNKALADEYKLNTDRYITKRRHKIHTRVATISLATVLVLGISYGSLASVIGSLVLAFALSLELNAAIEGYEYLEEYVALRIPLESASMDWKRFVPDTHVIRTSSRLPRTGEVHNIFKVESVYFVASGATPDGEMEAMLSVSDIYRGKYHKVTVPISDIKECAILSPSEIEEYKNEYDAKMFKIDCKELYS